MKKIINIIFLGIVAFVILNLDVNATNTYVNKNGVIIDSAVVTEFNDFIPSEYFDIMTQKEYNNYKFLAENEHNSISKIQAVHSLIKNGQVIDSYTNVLSEKEYEIQSSIAPITNCYVSDAQACWETSYKKITLTLAIIKDKKYFSASVFNQWLKEPTIKSADVIAMRYTGSLTKSDYWGEQYYTANGKSEKIFYNKDNSNMQAFSNGVGLTMNLVDSGSKFSNALNLNGYYSNISDVTFYATYQHAQSNVTVANSKKYSLSSNGLGGVIKFNSSSISNCYDGMQGISFPLSKV